MDIAVKKAWNSKTLCNVAGALAEQARLQPETTAVRYPDPSLFNRKRYSACNYAQLDELSDSYARGLRAHGIKAGTRTALMLRPGLEFIAVFFALFKVGAVPVLIDPGIGLGPLKQCLDEAAPEAFIGVTKAQWARRLKGWANDSCKILVTHGFNLGLGGISLKQLRKLGGERGDAVLEATQPDDMAAILFTSGSTGIPKGVVYRHRHFTAQVELLKSAFQIEPGEVGLSTFPPFALFDPALGMTTVIPDMDPTQPAKADPEELARVIDEYKVTNLFGSPALLDVLGRWAEANKRRMWSVTRVISAGAAVPLETIRRMELSLASDASINTPYGATECLPVSTVSNRELDQRVTEMTESGEGIFVGKPVAPNQVRVIRISDNAIEHLEDTTPMPPGMVGEIIVSGPSCTDAYWARPQETEMAKLVDTDGNTWHRMGDAGSIDGSGGLWFCGRVSQRVDTGSEVLFPDQCEAVFNQHPDARRTALVGVGPRGRQIPVLCVELAGPLAPVDMERVHYDLLQLAQAYPLTRAVRTILFHPGFPVDIRHNSKIQREQLAEWAARKMQQS